MTTDDKGGSGVKKELKLDLLIVEQLHMDQLLLNKEIVAVFQSYDKQKGNGLLCSQLNK